MNEDRQQVLTIYVDSVYVGKVWDKRIGREIGTNVNSEEREMFGSGRAPSIFSRLHFPLAVTTLAGAVLTGGVFAADAPKSPAAKPASSCIACHTDAAKLKAEAAKVPVPAGSALQAGKG